MWNAICAVSDKLKAYRTPDREDRYVPLMLHAVSELKLYSVSGEDLISAAEKMEGDLGTLPARLYDLGLIYSAYNALLRDTKNDPDEILDALADMLCENDYFSQSAVFIDSFLTLTPKEMAVVQRIFEKADETLVTFATSGEDRALMQTEFVEDYKKEMTRLVNRAAKPLKITEVPENRCDVFSYLAKNLWDYEAKPYDGDTDNVTVIKCADRYDEAALAATKIKALVADGASFGEIACVSADFEALKGITDMELERQGIPVYVSGKTPVTSQPAIRLLLSLCAVCAGGWKREDIMAAVRTGLCSLSSDEADALEMYTEKWRIRGKKSFCSPDGWSMNAGGYTENESEWALKL